MSKQAFSRLGYADVLRCLAALAVVTLHCAGATLTSEDPASTRFLILNFLDGGCRWAVPMFLMLTGMFLLDPARPMGAKKLIGHLVRVAAPLVLWAFFYALYDTRAAHKGLEHILEALIRVVKVELHYHLWYLPVLMGLYLLIPALRALIRGASRQCLWYLTGLWAVAGVILPTFYVLRPAAITRPWFNQFGLSSFASYAGYLLLGYLLKTCKLDRKREWAVYVLGALGLVATCTGTRLLSLRAGGLNAELYGNLTPNVCLAAAAIFLLCRRLELGRSPVWAKAAPGTFGVYLLHPLLIHLCQSRGLPRPAWNVAWAVPAEALVIFAVSLAVSLLLRRIPKIGKYIC